MPMFEVHNYGIPGDDVKSLLLRLSHVEKEVSSAEIILVMIGTNNVIAQDYTFIDELRRIIIRLRKKYTTADIIINSLPPINIELLVEGAITHLNDLIENLTIQTGCCYLQNFSKIESPEDKLFQPDGVHLTETTYDKWARSILEYVAFLLEDD